MPVRAFLDSDLQDAIFLSEELDMRFNARQGIS